MASKLVASSYNLLFFALLIICYAHSSNSLTSPDKFLKDLNGTRKGDRANGLIELKKYLEHLGYIDYNNPSNSMHRNDDVFDDTLESAIKKYQNYFNHKITGFLDQETVKLISRPRCGVPDNMMASNSSIDYGSLNHKDIHLSNMSSHYQIIRPWPPRWYNLSFSYPGDVSMAVSAEVATAMEKWERFSPIRFRYTGFNDARVLIGFRRLEHGDGWPFDGPGGIFAHAFHPTIGLMHFDADERWTTSQDRLTWRSLDVQSVALHELGHILGLGHSKIKDAVMYPLFDYGMAHRYLSRDDINGIRALYNYY